MSGQSGHISSVDNLKLEEQRDLKLLGCWQDENYVATRYVWW